ncbi:MAG: universal stress protein [Solirubrobacteraceae bacterium]|nr:universal stress protein [Solirubrobacteraceae bacterium]
MTHQRPIIVGYDGSDEARAAMLWALRDAPSDQPLKVVAVLGLEPSPIPGLSRLSGRPDEADRVAMRIAGRWDEDSRALGHIIDLEFTRGRPAQALAEIAEHEDAAMIVVGHRRTRALAPLRSSVARDLIRLSGCPVVVVP